MGLLNYLEHIYLPKDISGRAVTLVCGWRRKIKLRTVQQDTESVSRCLELECALNIQKREPVPLTGGITASLRWRCQKHHPGRVFVSQAQMAGGFSRSVKKRLMILSVRSMQCLFWGSAEHYQRYNSGKL